MPPTRVTNAGAGKRLAVRCQGGIADSRAVGPFLGPPIMAKLPAVLRRRCGVARSAVTRPVGAYCTRLGSHLRGRYAFIC